MRVERSYHRDARWVLLVEQGALVEGHELAIRRGRGFATRKAALGAKRQYEQMGGLANHEARIAALEARARP